MHWIHENLTRKTILFAILILLLGASIINLLFMLGIFDKTKYIELLEIYVAPDNLIAYPFRALLKIQVVLVFLILLCRSILVLRAQPKPTVFASKSAYLFVLWFFASWSYLKLYPILYEEHVSESLTILLAITSSVVLLMLVLSVREKSMVVKPILFLLFAFFLFSGIEEIQFVLLFLVLVSLSIIILRSKREKTELLNRAPYFLVLCLFISWFYIESRILFAEDGFYESLTALLAITSAIILLILLFKVREGGIIVKGVLFLLFIGFLVFGMEEISWGQRIVGWKTPESMKEWNYQDETNLHNWLNPYMTLIYRVVVGVLAGLLLFQGHLVRIAERSPVFSRFLPFVPPSDFVYFGIISTFLFVYSIATGGEYTELVEIVCSVIGITYTVNLYKKLKKSNT